MAKQLRIGENLRIDPPEEIVLVRGAIRKALGNPGIFLRANVQGPSAFEVVLTHTEGLAEEEGGGGIVHLVSAGDWRYWLSVLLEFGVATGAATFKSASMTIWRSALVTVSPTRILRAEWATKKDAHAQPHWHVYLAEWERGLSEPATRSMERFHLAMTAEWCSAESSHYREPSAVGVASWFQHCLVYTRRQLESISKRN